MILNSAVIERYLIDGKTYEDTKEFIDALLACDDLVADVYVNYKRVASGPLSLSVNNSWVIANVDERMSIINMDGNAYVINIVVHQLGCDELEDVIMRSTSPLSTFIDPGDIDADLYFSVMATVPECTQECHVPESEFNMMGTNNIVPKDFTDKNQCPDDPTIPEPEPGGLQIFYDIYSPNLQVFINDDFEEDTSQAYTWTFKAGNVVHEDFQWSNKNIYLNGSGDETYEQLLAAVDSGESLYISVKSEDGSITVCTNVLATPWHHAVCTYDAVKKTFRIVVYDNNDNIIECNPEESYQFGAVFGDGKGAQLPPAYIMDGDFTGHNQLVLQAQNVSEDGDYSDAYQYYLSQGANTCMIVCQGGSDISIYNAPAQINYV